MAWRAMTIEACCRSNIKGTVKEVLLVLRPGDYLEIYSHLKIIWIHFLFQQISFKWGKEGRLMANEQKKLYSNVSG